MENVLKARITADITGLKAGLVQAEKSLEKANGIFKKASKSVFELENEIARLSKRYKEGAISEQDFAKQSDVLNRKLKEQRENVRVTGQEISRLNTLIKVQSRANIAAPINNMSQATKGLTTNVRGANTVAQEFSRIVQDAPFGIIGVTNNIQQLSSNFSNLSKNAGSTGAALKAGLSAIVSPANLALLAISAVTAGFTAYQMGAFDGLFATKDFAKEAEEAAEKLQKYRDSLDAVSRAQIEGAGSAEKELGNLKLLVAQIESDTVSREDKLEAVKQLQDQYPDYLGNLTQEQILTGDVGDAYKNLTQQIIATSKARAASDAIAENSLKLLTLESQLNANIEEQKRLGLITSQKAVSISGTGATVITEQQQAEQQITKLKDKQLAILEQILPIKEDDKRLTEEINKNIAEGARFTNNQKTATEDANKAAKDNLAVWTDEQWQEAVTLQERLARAYNSLKPSEQDPMTAIQNKLAKDMANMGAPVEEIVPSIDSAKMKMDELDTKAKNLQESFSVLGSVITSAFAGNPGLGQFAASLAKFAGEIIARNFAIAKSNVIVGATAAGTAAGPAAPFVTPTLIASGLAVLLTAFKGLIGGSGSGGGKVNTGSSQTFGNVGNRREFGGSVISGKSYVVGEKRPELFVPSSNGIIVPSIPTMGSNGIGSGGAASNRIVVDVVGVIDNDVIRIQNKKSINKVNRA